MSESAQISLLSTAQMLSMTVAKLVVYGQQILSPSSDSAKLDTEILLCFVLDKPKSFLLTWPNHKLSSEQAAHFSDLMSRRIQGEPIAYITKLREFWSLPLQVSPATLIPRPDTEVLVEAILLRHQIDNARCLDLGTGTGAIALALASEQPRWDITGVDYSLDAVELAQSNATRLALTQVEFYQSNWFDKVAKEPGFDIIVSNPPYIDEHDHHLAVGDVKFEPKTALVAADNGLADIKLIAQHARDFLVPGGYLYIEHGFEQSASVQSIFSALGYDNIQTIQDYNDNDRVTLARYTKE